SESKGQMPGVIHFLQVFVGMMCMLGGTPAAGGVLVGTLFGMPAGLIASLLFNVVMIIAMPGIPRMYGSGSLVRWFCFTLPAEAVGCVIGTVLSTAVGGILGVFLGMLIGGLIAGVGAFFLQRRIPDWKQKSAGRFATRPR